MNRQEHRARDEATSPIASRARDALERAAAEADHFMESRAGERWTKIKRQVSGLAKVAAVKPNTSQAAPEDEPEAYPGASASALQDVCEAAGFAFAELWTRSKFEVPAEDDREAQVQWDHLLSFANVTHTNFPAFPEAYNLQGKLDEFVSAGREQRYAKNSSIPGLAWNRGSVDWQDLSVYDVLEETLQADTRINLAMELFDASMAIPLRHAIYDNFSAVAVFYRNRSAADATALCHAPEFRTHPALVALVEQAYQYLPRALHLEEAMPAWRTAQEYWRHDQGIDDDDSAHRHAHHGHDLRAYGFGAGSALGERIGERLSRLRQHIKADLEHIKADPRYQTSKERLTALEREWAKGRMAGWLITYTAKWKGTGSAPAKGSDANYCAWVMLGSMLAIGTMTYIDDVVDEYSYNYYSMYALVTHFSAVALILFSTPTSPFGQPRNVVGGHVICAIIAVVLDSNKLLVGMDQTTMNAVAPACAIAVMTWTGLMHPPAAACCFIFVSGGPRVKNLGYLFIFFPILMDVAIMLVLAIVINNCSENRRYPVYW